MAKRASKEKDRDVAADQDVNETSRPASTASAVESNPDRYRDTSRRQASARRFQTNLKEEDIQKASESSSADGRKSSKKAEQPRTMDDVRKERGIESPAPQAFGQIDHASALHGRGEHTHNGARAGARIEGPAPIRLKDLPSDEQVLETLRLETKADNLYFMRREERESAEPRGWVIDAINARLREVQGDPILPE